MKQPEPCRSWRGHKFEPRYSEKETSALPPDTIRHVAEPWLSEVITAARLHERFYEADVCVRCGLVLVPQKPNADSH